MLSEARPVCTRCGDVARSGARICERCGTRVAPDAPAGADAPLSTFLDTIHLPGMTEGEARQTRVRPALAVLYRVAVGPSADYYAPRFLKYEKAGHGLPGWHWPSFWLGSAWAFYRKLWLEGLAFALLPVAGAFAFYALAPRIDNVPVPWLVGAALAIWFLPGIIPALLANSLLYRRVRRLVQKAEASTGSAAQVASTLARRNPVSLAAAILLGGGALVLAGNIVAPGVRGAYFEHEVRAKVSAALASVRPLEVQIEESWTRLRTIPRKLDTDSLRVQAAAAFFDEVSFRPANGRLRLALGASIPELFGRSILLAPAVDPAQRIQWMCIPIDIPAKYLPMECRNG
jgi:Protein of unknown function (DUF2628)/Pilin (bacterial filament)